MADRVYSVRYDIVAEAGKAIETFNSLQNPLVNLKRNSQKLSSSLTTTVERLIKFKEVLNEISSTSKNIEIKVNFDIASFNRNLKEMELNAKTSAARIRGTFESIFKDTHGDFMSKQSLLGTPIKQHVSGISKNMSKEIDEMIKASETLNRKVAQAARQHTLGRALKKEGNGYKLAPGGADILRNLYGGSSGPSKEDPEKLKNRAVREIKSLGIALTQAEMDLWKSLNGVSKKASVENGNLSFGGQVLGNREKLIRDAIEERRKEIVAEKATLQKEQKDIAKNLKPLMGSQKVSPGQPFLSNLAFNPREIMNAAKSYEKLIGSISEKAVDIKVRLTGLGEVREQFTSFVNNLKTLGESKLFSPASATKYKNPNSFPLTANVGANPNWLSPDIARMINTQDGYSGFQYYAKSDELWGAEAAKYEKAMEDIEKRLIQNGMIGKGNRVLKKTKDYFQSGDQRRYSPTSVMVLEELTRKAAEKGVFDVPIKNRYVSPVTSAGAATEKLMKAMTISQTGKGTGEFVINVSGNYKQHMASLADFATSLPLLKSKNVEVKIGVAGLSSEAVNQIKNIAVPKEAKVTVPLSLSYKNARDMVPRTLGVLQRIIAERGGVKVPLTIDRTKVGGQLNSLVRNLRTLIAENRLTIPVNLQSLDMKKSKNVPTINVKAKVTGLTSAVREANKAFQERVRNMKNSPALKIPIQLKWGDKENNMRAQIKRMQSSIPALKVSVDLTLAKAQIDDLAAYIQRKGIINMGAMSGPKSQGPFRNYRPGSGESFAAGAVGGGRRGSGGGDSGGRVYGGGGEGGNFLTRLRRFAYPLTGNLSYGASSPMALQMFKDMPVMMGVGGAIGAVTNGIGQAFEYQDTMRVARSILERSYKGNNFEKDYRNMEMTARNVARNTKFTGKEAADAVRFMAMAGLDIPKINSSIKPIADIALIGRNNLGDIADIMTNVQTTYKIPADKMERMADAMANTFTKTNVDMMMIAESLKYAGGIAQLTGTSLGDSLAMIGIMGNNGIQGSMAGTSTRMMMQNMIRPNKGQAAMWKSLGISTTDEHGFVKDPIKLLGELKGYVDKKYGSKEYMELGKGEEFKNKALGTLVSNMFRVTSTAGVAALLRDYDKLVELSESNKSSSINGLSSRLSGFQQNEVKGLVAKVSSSLQEQILQIIEKNTGWIKKKLIEANEWMSSPETKSKLESLIETLKNIVDGFIDVGRGALWAYEKFNSIKIFGNGLVDFLIKFQLYMTAIGSTLRLVLSPLNIFSGFSFGGGMGAAGAGAAMGGTGFAAFAGTGIASLFNSRRRRGFSRDGYENLGSDFARTVSAGHHRKINTGFKGVNSLEALYMMDLAVGVPEELIQRTAATSASIRRHAIKVAKMRRRREQLLDSALISQFIMSRGVKNSAGLVGQSMRANFLAGRAFGSFSGAGAVGGIKSSLISSLTTGFMGLSKAMGLLLSPIGLATMAIGGLATAAYMLHKRNQKGREEAQKTIEKIRKVGEISNQNKGFSVSSLPDSSPLKVGVASFIPTSGIIKHGAVKNNVPLSRNTYFSSILNPSKGSFGTMGRQTSYADALYDEYIAKGLNVYGGQQIQRSAFLDEYNRIGGTKETLKDLQSKALQGAAMLSGANSNRVSVWGNYIKNQAEKIFAIKDADKRNKAWEDLEKRISEVSEKYKKQAENLKSVTDLQKRYGDNLKDAKSSEMMNTSEYRLAEAKAIADLMKNMGNTAVGQYLATHVLDAGVKDKSGAAIRAIVSGLGIKIGGYNGKSVETSLSFNKYGGIDWNKLQETLKKNGVDLTLTFENKLGIIERLYNLVKANPYYKEVTMYLNWIYNKISSNGPTNILGGQNPLTIQRNVDNIISGGGSIKRSSGLGFSSNIGSLNSGKSGFGFNGGSGLGRKAPDTFLPKTTTQMKNDKYGLLSYSGSGMSSKNNIVVNVGGITVNNDADMNEIETRIEKGVLTAMNAVLVDQSNNSMYNI